MVKFKDFSRQILFSRTFQDSPVYSSTFQACANPGIAGTFANSEDPDEMDVRTGLTLECPGHCYGGGITILMIYNILL